MKTFAALIRRYVLATAAIVLLVGGLLVGQIFYVGFKSNAVDATGYRVGGLADAVKQTETGERRQMAKLILNSLVGKFGASLYRPMLHPKPSGDV